MTIEEAMKSKAAFLSPADIAPILGSNPQTIRLQARLGTIGFPVVQTGNRVKIPRLPFLKLLGYEEK